MCHKLDVSVFCLLSCFLIRNRGLFGPCWLFLPHPLSADDSWSSLLSVIPVHFQSP